MLVMTMTPCVVGKRSRGVGKGVDDGDNLCWVISEVGKGGC